MSSSSDSSNVFDQALTDSQGLEQQLLGPDYKYYDNVNSPDQIGMSDEGSMSALSKDVQGLISYVQLLVEGTGPASKTGQPLGNKFFMKTGASCLDETNTEQDRYIYVSNVPTGNIPFISGAMGENFSEMKGLIPGTISNLNVLNPFGIMRAFLSGSTPSCQSITMETIDVNNNKSSETHYVTTVDIQNMDPCIFSNGSNPVTGASCKQAFQNIDYDDNTSLPKDPLVQLYFLGLSILGIYIVYRLGNK